MDILVSIAHVSATVHIVPSLHVELFGMHVRVKVDTVVSCVNVRIIYLVILHD